MKVDSEAGWKESWCEMENIGKGNYGNSGAHGVVHQQASSQQEFLNYPQPLIGLKYITEIHDDNNIYFYCDLCNERLDNENKFNHVTDERHRYAVIKREEGEWARKIDETSQSHLDFQQRLHNAAMRLEQNAGRDRINVQVEHSNKQQNNYNPNYAVEQHPMPYANQEGHGSYTSKERQGADSYYNNYPPPPQPDGAPSMMVQPMSPYKEDYPKEYNEDNHPQAPGYSYDDMPYQNSDAKKMPKIFEKSYRGKHWEHDDRGREPVRNNNKDKRNYDDSSSTKSLHRSRSSDSSRSPSREKSRSRSRDKKRSRKSPRPYSRPRSPACPASPLDIAQEIEEERKRQERRAEERRRANERKKRHAERERKEEEEKKKKEKEKIVPKDVKNIPPPPKAPTVLDEDTKRLVMQNLTELAKCCVTNEADAELALQVSNALTQAILQYRMKNMPESVLASLGTNQLNQTSQPPQPPTQALKNNQPSMQQYINQNEPLPPPQEPPFFNQPHGLPQQLPHQYNQPRLPHVDRGFNQSSPINNRAIPSMNGHHNRPIPPTQPGARTMQPGLPLPPSHNQPSPMFPGTQPNFPLGPSMSQTGLVANENNPALMQQIRHLIQQSLVEQHPVPYR